MSKLRSAVIRLAAAQPKGSVEQQALLGLLKQAGRPTIMTSYFGHGGEYPHREVEALKDRIRELGMKVFSQDEELPPHIPPALALRFLQDMKAQLKDEGYLDGLALTSFEVLFPGDTLDESTGGRITWPVRKSVPHVQTFYKTLEKDSKVKSLVKAIHAAIPDRDL
jgi:hypothetical protein